MKLIISDLHLTDNINDEYRWKIFDYLIYLCNKYIIHELIILGDITEKKDTHSSKLLHLMINHFIRLTELCKVSSINILCGNHDYIDSNNPYFLFLNKIDTFNCNINFIYKPTKIVEDLYIPHYYTDFSEISKKYSFCNNLFLHHSFNGIMLRSGSYEDKGNDSNNLTNIKFNNCYSGHIHFQQTYKNIEYIGSPYAIKFGDNNKGRVLLIKDGKKKYINLPRFINKIDVKLTNPEEIRTYDILEQDQVKVEINLTLQNCHEYSDMVQYIKKYVEDKGATISSIQGKLIQDVNITNTIVNTVGKLDSNEIIKRFCNNKQLPNNYRFIANNALNGFTYSEN